MATRGKLNPYWIFITTLKSVNWRVYASLILSAIGIINYEGRVVTLEDPSPILLGINAFVSQCLVAYVTGCVLYFLIDLVPRTKKRISVYLYISNKFHRIFQRINGFYNSVAAIERDGPQEYRMDEKKLTSILANVDFETKEIKAFFYPMLPLKQFTVRICHDIKEAANDILSHGELLDHRWLKSLAKIADLADSAIKETDIQYKKVTVPIYYLWGLHVEVQRLGKLMSEYDQDYLRNQLKTGDLLSPPGHTVPVNKKKA